MGIRAMPENKILDPFKPAQPRIPGVSAPEEKPSASAEAHESQHTPGLMGPPPFASDDSAPKLKFLWVGLTLAGALATTFLLFSLKRNPTPAQATPGAKPANPAPSIAREVPVADTKLPMGPGEIATTAQLSKPWSSARFYFRDPVTSKPAPAMVVHLPGGTFWGFSLVEPFGNCVLEYVTDLQKLRTTYAFDEAAHPMVVDPCNGTVFDLTHYGNAPSGLVRGEIEKGAGWRPPLAIEIRIQGNKVIAARMER
jgi:hypothetical protein